jgi:hypothetical protein
MRVPRRSHRTHDRILRADPSSLLFSIVHRSMRLNDVNDPFHFSNCRPFFYIFNILAKMSSWSAIPFFSGIDCRSKLWIQPK